MKNCSWIILFIENCSSIIMFIKTVHQKSCWIQFSFTLTRSSADRREHIYPHLPSFNSVKDRFFINRINAYLNERYPATSSFVLTRLGLTLELSDIFGFNRKFRMSHDKNEHSERSTIVLRTVYTCIPVRSGVHFWRFRNFGSFMCLVHFTQIIYQKFVWRQTPK